MSDADFGHVLVLAYNRPESLSRLLDHLIPSPAKSISVWIDGPKLEAADQRDVRSCLEIASGRLQGADDAVYVNKVNLGCRTSVTQGIEWFLGSHATGVILEDDILPSKDFFPYMNEALALGPNHGPVELGSIAGFNCVPASHQQSPGKSRASVFFSSWGWGTWASQWSRLRMDLMPWRLYAEAISDNPILNMYGYRYLRQIHNLISIGRLDSWAYVALLEHLRLGLKVQVPSRSLVENTGFNTKASHTSRKPEWLLPSQSSMVVGSTTRCSSLPDNLSLDEIADDYMSREVFEFISPWGLRKAVLRLARWQSRFVAPHSS